MRKYPPEFRQRAIARRHEDALLLDLAYAMEKAQPWPLVAPSAPV